MFEGFTKETSDFLWELSFHNERPWFNEHKEQYLRVLHDPFHTLAEDCSAIMTQNYPFSDFSLHVSRIYRDARRLFGRGPYKDHLWFTLKNAGNVHTEGPMFWFEIDAATFSYGLGFFDVSPLEMAAFRAAIDANPARFERLAADADKMRGFRVTGPLYKRPKKECSPLIDPWYNRRRVGLECKKNFDPALLGPDLPKTLCRAYDRLMPLYEFLYTAYLSAQKSETVSRKEEGENENG